MAVSENAMRSKSSETRADAVAYATRINTNLPRIGNKLRNNSFVFLPQTGVLISKKNSRTKRPIVIAPIDSRIVQRALLNTLQSVPTIKAIQTSGFNFGGVRGPGWGVPGAMIKLIEAIQHHGYFIRTDVKSFFMTVPRERATDLLLTHISDAKLADLVRQAIRTEIDDAMSYGDDIHIFPISDEGVAQGSCLSPLLCNNLLHDFDKAMNGRGIVTIRYIDDFILLAKDRRTAFAAFASAQRLLGELGMSAYDPINPADKEKAEHGNVRSGITFLGCEVWPNRLRPCASNWKSFLSSLDAIFDLSIKHLKNPATVMRKHATYAETVVRASKTVQGWANTYNFCTDDQLMKNIDIEVTKSFSKYNENVRRILASQSATQKRKSLGVFLIDDRVRSVERIRADEIIRMA